MAELSATKGLTALDADTLLDPVTGRRIRLHGVDAFESGTPEERAVRQQVTQQFLDRNPDAQLDRKGQGFFGRDVADVVAPSGERLSHRLAASPLVNVRDFSGGGGDPQLNLIGAASRFEQPPPGGTTIQPRETPALNAERGLAQEFGAGLRRGADTLQAGLYGAVSAVGDLIEDKSKGDARAVKNPTVGDRVSAWLQRVGDKGFMRNMEEAQRSQASESFRDAIEGDASLLRWAFGAIGEAAPSLVGMAAGAGVGGAVGVLGRAAANRIAAKRLANVVAKRARAQGMSNQAAQQVSERFVQNLPRYGHAAVGFGQGAGAFAFGAGVETGHIFEEAKLKFGDASAAASIAGGSIAGALDLVGAMGLLKTIMPKATDGAKRALIERMLKGAGLGVATEGLTEATQEAINIIAVESQNPDDSVPLEDRLLTEENGWQLAAAAAAGALFGGTVGATGGLTQPVFDALRARKDTSESDSAPPDATGAAPVSDSPDVEQQAENIVRENLNVTDQSSQVGRTNTESRAQSAQDNAADRRSASQSRSSPDGGRQQSEKGVSDDTKTTAPSEEHTGISAGTRIPAEGTSTGPASSSTVAADRSSGVSAAADTRSPGQTAEVAERAGPDGRVLDEQDNKKAEQEAEAEADLLGDVDAASAIERDIEEFKRESNVDRRPVSGISGDAAGRKDVSGAEKEVFADQQADARTKAGTDTRSAAAKPDRREGPGQDDAAATIERRETTSVAVADGADAGAQGGVREKQAAPSKRSDTEGVRSGTAEDGLSVAEKSVAKKFAAPDSTVTTDKIAKHLGVTKKVAAAIRQNLVAKKFLVRKGNSWVINRDRKASEDKLSVEEAAERSVDHALTKGNFSLRDLETSTKESIKASRIVLGRQDLLQKRVDSGRYKTKAEAVRNIERGIAVSNAKLAIIAKKFKEAEQQKDQETANRLSELEGILENKTLRANDAAVKDKFNRLTGALNAGRLSGELLKRYLAIDKELESRNRGAADESPDSSVNSRASSTNQNNRRVADSNRPRDDRARDKAGQPVASVSATKPESRTKDRVSGKPDKPVSRAVDTVAIEKEIARAIKQGKGRAQEQRKSLSLKKESKEDLIARIKELSGDLNSNVNPKLLALHMKLNAMELAELFSSKPRLSFSKARSDVILKNFLSKLGVTVEIRNLKQELGIDALGVFSILHKYVALQNARVDVLPSIAAEFAVKYFGDPQNMKLLLKEVTNTPEWFALRLPNRTKGAKYEIIAKYLATELQNAIQPKGVAAQFMAAIKRLAAKITKVLQSSEFKRFNEEINALAAKVMDPRFKPSQPAAGAVKVSLEQAMKDNPFEANLVAKLSQLGFVLTGSAALSSQGNIFRSATNLLHDVDFVAPDVPGFDVALGKESLLEALPKHSKNGVQLVREILPSKGVDVKTWTYAVTKNPAHSVELDIKQVTETYSTLEKWIVRDADGNMVQTFSAESNTIRDNNGLEVAEGDAAIAFVDFFESRGAAAVSTNDVSVSTWQEIFAAKLAYGRTKDVTDWVHFSNNLGSLDDARRNPATFFVAGKDRQIQALSEAATRGKESAAELRQRFDSLLQGSVVRSGIDPELMSLGVKLVAKYVEEGVSRSVEALKKKFDSDGLGSVSAHVAAFMRGERSVLDAKDLPSFSTLDEQPLRAFVSDDTFERPAKRLPSPTEDILEAKQQGAKALLTIAANRPEVRATISKIAQGQKLQPKDRVIVNELVRQVLNRNPATPSIDDRAIEDMLDSLADDQGSSFLGKMLDAADLLVDNNSEQIPQDTDKARESDLSLANGMNVVGQGGIEVVHYSEINGKDRVGFRAISKFELKGNVDRNPLLEGALKTLREKGRLFLGPPPREGWTAFFAASPLWKGVDGRISTKLDDILTSRRNEGREPGTFYFDYDQDSKQYFITESFKQGTMEDSFVRYRGRWIPMADAIETQSKVVFREGQKVRQGDLFAQFGLTLHDLQGNPHVAHTQRITELGKVLGQQYSDFDAFWAGLDILMHGAEPLSLNPHTNFNDKLITFDKKSLRELTDARAQERAREDAEADKTLEALRVQIRAIDQQIKGTNDRRLKNRLRNQRAFLVERGLHERFKLAHPQVFRDEFIEDFLGEDQVDPDFRMFTEDQQAVIFSPEEGRQASLAKGPDAKARKEPSARRQKQVAGSVRSRADRPDLTVTAEQIIATKSSSGPGAGALRAKVQRAKVHARDPKTKAFKLVSELHEGIKELRDTTIYLYDEKDLGDMLKRLAKIDTTGKLREKFDAQRKAGNGTAAVFFGDRVFIYLDSSLSDAQTLDGAAHELGHVIYRRLLKHEYDKKSEIWRRIRDGFAKDTDRNGSIEEWFADQVAVWARKKRKPQNILERMFKTTFDAISTLWNMVNEMLGHTRWQQQTGYATVEGFMDGLIARQTPEVIERAKEMTYSGNHMPNPGYDMTMFMLAARNSFWSSSISTDIAFMNGGALLASADQFTQTNEIARVVRGGLADAAHFAGWINDRLLKSADGWLRTQNIPAYEVFADLVYRREGEAPPTSRTIMIGNRHVTINIPKESYFDAVHREYALWSQGRGEVKGFEDVLGKVDSDTMSVVLKHMQAEKPIDALQTAEQRETASKIRLSLDKFWEDFISVNSTKPIGFLRKYFPRVYNIAAIKQDIDGFHAVLARHLDNWSRVDTNELVQRMGEGFAFVDAAAMEDFLPPNVKASNKRKFAKIPSSALQRFLEPDLLATMRTYFHQTVKRVEWDRRMTRLGPNDNIELLLPLMQLSARHSGATAPQQTMFNRIHEAYLGRLGADLDPGVRKVMSWVQTIQNVLLLPFATLSSLIDLANPTIRSHQGLATSWQSLMAAVRAYKQKGGSLYDMAATHGIVVDKIAAGVVSEKFNSGWMSEGAQWFNEKFFRAIGMNAWTNFSRLYALQMGIMFLKKHANTPEKHSERWLKELGLDAATIKRWVAEGEKTWLVDTDRSDSTAEAIQVALQRFVQESVFLPNAAQRPAWGSDPIWMLVWHLKQFTWSFTKIILGRAFREMKKRPELKDKLAVALPFIAMAPLAMLGMGIRDWLKWELLPWREGKPEWMEPGAGEWAMDVVRRTGVLGPLDLLLTAEESARWGNFFVLSALGPTASAVGDYFTQDFTSWLPEHLPFTSILPEERALLRNFLEKRL